MKNFLFFLSLIFSFIACSGESETILSYHYDTSISYNENLLLLDSISNCINDPFEMETFEKIDSIYIDGNTISIPYQIYCDKDNMKSVGVYIHGDTLNIALIEKEKTPNFSIDCPVWIYGTLKSNIKGNYIETPFNVYPLGKK